LLGGGVGGGGGGGGYMAGDNVSVGGLQSKTTGCRVHYFSGPTQTLSPT